MCEISFIQLAEIVADLSVVNDIGCKFSRVGTENEKINVGVGVLSAGEVVAVAYLVVCQTAGFVVSGDDKSGVGIDENELHRISNYLVKSDNGVDSIIIVVVVRVLVYVAFLDHCKEV